jgi:hypothetical protein
MSTVGELFAILAVVYLVDCFRWVSRSAVLFREVPLLGWGRSKPWHVGAQLRRSIAFGFPLPPFGSLLDAEPLPFRPGPEGLVFPAADEDGWVRPAKRDRCVAWKDLGTLKLQELELHGPEGLVAVFGSRAAAASAGALLEALRQVEGNEKKRERAVREALEARFDAPAFEARLKPWRRWSLLAHLFNSLLFVAVFGGFAVALLRSGAVPVVRLLLQALIAWCLALAVTLLAIRRGLPRPAQPRTGQWVTTVLSPLSLMRAGDLFDQDLAGGVDPLVPATVLLPERALREYLSLRRRELQFPLTPRELELAEAPWQAQDEWLRAELRARVEKLAADRKLDLDEGRPTGLHCPRCWSGYTGTATECASCHGVALVTTP